MDKHRYTPLCDGCAFHRPEDPDDTTYTCGARETTRDPKMRAALDDHMDGKTPECPALCEE